MAELQALLELTRDREKLQEELRVGKRTVAELQREVARMEIALRQVEAELRALVDPLSKKS